MNSNIFTLSHLKDIPKLNPPPRRNQVKIACVNCKASCKKCDESRPCLRCINRGMESTCVDSERKARKKGVQRGPYKKTLLRQNTYIPFNISIHSYPQPPIYRTLEAPTMDNLVIKNPNLTYRSNSHSIYQQECSTASSLRSYSLNSYHLSPKSDDKIPSIKTLLNEDTNSMDLLNLPPIIYNNSASLRRYSDSFNTFKHDKLNCKLSPILNSPHHSDRANSKLSLKSILASPTYY